jgi:hypothetical protein
MCAAEEAHKILAETLAYNKLASGSTHPNPPPRPSTSMPPNNFTRPVKTVCVAHVKRVGLALSIVHHRHIGKVAYLEHLLHLVSKNLLNLHKNMQKEAGTIAGEFHTNNHQVGFNSMVPWQNNRYRKLLRFTTKLPSIQLCY